MASHWVPLGEIVTTHGLKGWLKLRPYNPDSSALLSAREVVLERKNSRSVHALQAARLLPAAALVKLAGMDSLEQAEPWVGATLAVGDESLEPLGPGEYYYYQTIGLDVFDTAGQWIGKVIRVWMKPGGDLYVVAGHQKEHLIPAVREIIEKVDLIDGKLVIRVPAGLLDL